MKINDVQFSIQFELAASRVRNSTTKQRPILRRSLALTKRQEVIKTWQIERGTAYRNFATNLNLT
jgi:hypothetical protein